MEKTKEFGKITAESDDKTCCVSVWNRRYLFGKSPLLSSVISSGKELLASPMRVVATENGSEAVWEDVKNFVMDGDEDDEIRVCQSMQSARFVLNNVVTVSEDGCMEWSVTVVPRGRSVNQVFGIEKEDKGDRILSRLWIEIPLKKECAKFYQVVPGGNVVLDGENKDKLGALAWSGATPEKSIDLPFKEQVFLTNDETGFGVFFESDEFWQPLDKNKAISCEVRDGEVVLRIRLLDEEPKCWKEKGSSNGMDLFPLTFSMGMMVTPVKEFPQNPYKERAVHIDCFKKIAPDYEDYLFGEYESDGETVFDKIKRQGVNTLYIHEKWNDLQNSPEITRKTADRLKLIVDGAHKRNIKVIPYFGYEISTLSPEFGKHYKEYVSVDGMRGNWYRKPWQRDVVVCYASGWQDYFVNKIDELFAKYGIDGIYLDSIAVMHTCKNESHGCGYRDYDGNLVATYPVRAVRRLMKRLSKVTKKYNGTIASHSYGSFALPTLYYTDLFWEGESVQSIMLKGELDEAPIDYYRSVYTGRNVGVPVNMLCYSNPPEWTTRQATATALAFGVMPKPNDAGAFLDEISEIWKVLDGFSFVDAKWKPFYDNDVSVSDENVVVSYYENENQGLFFVCNMKNQPTKVSVKLPSRFCKIKDAISGKDYRTELSLEFKKFDYAIISAYNEKKR